MFGFHDDPQRAFYSAYFSGHGLKVQVVGLPNGMIGLVYLASWRESDSGVLNMSGLDQYLQGLFQEYGISNLNGNNTDGPAIYGDGIFPQLATIVDNRNSDNNDGVSSRINTIMASAREVIEHMFGTHYTIFELFNQPKQFKLMVNGEEATKLILNSFLLLNCYNCFNETNCNFMMCSITIEDYLPLYETLPMGPNINSPDGLGILYNYTVRHNNRYV